MALTPFNGVISGVGGQGVLLAARVIAEAVLKKGETAFMGEVHGMAQRGGTVIATVRIGNVQSGMVGPGEADLVLGLEAAETFRMREFLNNKTWVIMNERRIPPMSVNLGRAVYSPNELLVDGLRCEAATVLTVPALELAIQAGSRRAENTVMLGALSATECLPVGVDLLRETILELVPASWRQVNEAAFDLGRGVGRDRLDQLSAAR